MIIPMHTLEVMGREYNEHIPFLLRKTPKGHIHSVFQNGFNLLYGSSLIFIGNKKNGKIPFGIHLNTFDINPIIRRISVPANVLYDKDKNKLLFPDFNLAITLSEAIQFHNRYDKLVENNELNNENLPILLQVLFNLDISICLGINIEHFLDAFLGIVLPNDIERKVLLLMNVFINYDTKYLLDVMTYFIGRGKGLTPSGDDLIIGFLSIMEINKQISIKFRETMQSFIRNQEITTDIGKEFLLYALKGEFSSTVIDAVNGLYFGTKEECINSLEKLIDTGHSSGLDTAFGMLVGILALRRKPK